MTSHREWFVNLDEKVKRKIKFADNSIVTAKGVGKLLIQRKDGRQSFIENVLFVPNMKNNLLSLGQLLEKGNSMVIEHGELQVFAKDRRLVFKAPLSKNRTLKIGIQIMEH